MNLASILWSFAVVDLLVISLEFVIIVAQTIQRTEYLNRQPVDGLLEQEQIEDENFVYYLPTETKPLDRVDPETIDDFIQKEDPSPMHDQEKMPAHKQALEVTRWQSAFEQEVYPPNDSSRYDNLVRRINLSTKTAPDSMVQFHELPDPQKARYVTTTARPTYDQIPRPLLFNKGQEVNSFE